jgi:hypothetical protein
MGSRSSRWLWLWRVGVRVGVRWSLLLEPRVIRPVRVDGSCWVPVVVGRDGRKDGTVAVPVGRVPTLMRRGVEEATQRRKLLPLGVLDSCWPMGSVPQRWGNDGEDPLRVQHHGGG